MDKHRVLFVDAEPQIIMGLRRMLRKQRDEWDMVFVTTAEEALVALAESHFDAFVTDMQMPTMDGAELLRQVARKHAATARIVLTGCTDESVATRAVKLAHQYLAKPADADTLKLAVLRACAARKAIQSERFRAALGACDTLPSPPHVYLEITKAAESETSSAGDIARIISCDMSMCAKLLQLVNSSFFGIGRRVSSTEQAVALLGIIRIKALVLADAVFKAFEPSRPVSLFSMDDLWGHSFAVANVARLISTAEKQSGDRPDQAFNAGLMHDIGMLILACKRTDEFEEVLQRVQVDKQPIGDVEANLLGVTHAEIGACLLELWGLPQRLVEAVALHHSPNRTPYDGLCALSAVHVADSLVSEVMRSESGDTVEMLAARLDMAYLERIDLAHRVEQWRELVMGAYENAMAPQA